jgi:ankyrin repeat protein
LLRLKIAVSGVESPEGMGTTMLQNAIRYQKAEVAKYLLEEGASVTARDDHGRTLAHYAFMHEAPSAEIRSLLAQHLDATLWNTPDYEGATALHFAVFHGDVAGFDFLLEHGCSICIKTAKGLGLSAYIDDLIGVDSQSKSSYVLELNERRRKIQARVLELESESNCPE